MNDTITEIECVVVEKQHGMDDWTAILEPTQIPQGMLAICFPYPDDVQIGESVYLRLAYKS